MPLQLVDSKGRCSGQKRCSKGRSDAIFGEPGSHQRKQAQTLRAREGVVRGGNDDVGEPAPGNTPNT